MNGVPASHVAWRPWFVQSAVTQGSLTGQAPCRSGIASWDLAGHVQRDLSGDLGDVPVVVNQVSVDRLQILRGIGRLFLTGIVLLVLLGVFIGMKASRRDR